MLTKNWQNNWSGRAILVALTMLLAAALLPACGPVEEEDREVTAQVFLQVEDFEYLRKKGALVLDARDEQTYKDGHVPGAIRADYTAFTYQDSKALILDEDEELQAAARALGINNDSTILVYGHGGTGDSAAARLVWTLEYLGASDIYLLDGGIEVYKAYTGNAVETGTRTATPGDFTVQRRPEIRATKAEVTEALESGEFVIIDTRGDDEWDGDNMRNNPRGGHIPNAVHFNWVDLLGEDGKLRDRDAILADLTDRGVEPGVLTIPYCQTGVRSSYFYLVLKWLDFPEPKNYDGSWWEWSRDDELPVINENRGDAGE